MQSEIVGNKKVLVRNTEEKLPILQRLGRIEGQVRGLKQMIDDNRHCGEAIQQTSAVIAAVREVALILISQQLQVQVADLHVRDKPEPSPHTAREIQDFVELLRATYRLQ